MSRLLENSKDYRKTNVSRSIYKTEDDYRVSHSRAKSDGDDNGKGELKGSVGSKTDIGTRNKSISTNKYNSEKPYGASNA